MSNKTFAQRATDIMNKESDPALQKDLLEGLMQEQEKYKADNGLNEPKTNGDQFANGGFGYTPTAFGNTGPMNNTNMWGQLGSGREAFAADGGIGDTGGGFMGNMFQNFGNSVGTPGTFANNAAGFGMQMIPSAISGITNFIGNKHMQERANELANQARSDYATLASPEKVKATQVAPEKISLANEREEARRTASDSRRTTQQQLKNAAKSRGQYLAGAGTASAQTDKVLGDILGRSRSREAQMNTAERNAVARFNAQAVNQAKRFNVGNEMAKDRFNAMAEQGGINNYYNWMQQGNLYNQGKYGAITGMMKDASNIAAQNQMISSLGDRYGYNRANWWAPNQYNINYQGRQG